MTDSKLLQHAGVQELKQQQQHNTLPPSLTNAHLYSTGSLFHSESGKISWSSQDSGVTWPASGRGKEQISSRDKKNSSSENLASKFLTDLDRNGLRLLVLLFCCFVHWRLTVYVTHTLTRTHPPFYHARTFHSLSLSLSPNAGHFENYFRIFENLIWPQVKFGDLEIVL